MLSLRSRLGRSKKTDRSNGDRRPFAPADALVAAETLADEGRRLDAIALLTDTNRATPDSAVEARLVTLRHEAFRDLDRSGCLPDWPPTGRDVFDGTAGLPEIGPEELSADAIRSGIVRHGGLVVRGLLPDSRVGQLIDDIDRTFDAHDAFHKGAPVEQTTPWYVPFEPNKDGSVAQIRQWVRGGGGVLTVESPRTLFDVLAAFDDVGLTAPLAGYLGERPALSAKKWTLRRVPLSSGTNWHQDGAFLGHDIRTVNVWLTLTRCGQDAPGLDIVPSRMPEILPTGTEGALFDWSVGDGVVERVAAQAPVQRPVFQAGDAILFDDYFLHRTAISPEMTVERYAIESWFFAPSHYPLDQIPITV